MSATSNGDGSSGSNSGITGGREAGKQRGGGGRSALISELVAQLKRGDISKAELFSRLQQLQGPTPAKAGTAMGDSAAGADSAPAKLSAGNAITTVGSTASSGGSSALASGTTAAESAGFFSAYDRQVGGSCAP